MFNATITGERLNSLIDSVTVLVDECKIQLSPNGISIRAVDPANVGMVESKLGKSAFETFNSNEGVIGVDLLRLEDIAGMAKDSDIISLTLDEETRKLLIEFDGLKYTLSLIDPDSIRQEPDIPDLDLPSSTVIEGHQLNRFVTASDMVSDHLTLGVNESDKEFFVEAQGDTDDVEITLDQDDVIDMTAGEAKSMFSLDYYKDMNKAIPKDAEVTIELGEEFPVKMYYSTSDGECDVTYMLAPRIQSD